MYAQQAVAGGAVVGEPMGAGGGSSDVVPNYTVTPLEGIRNALEKLGNKNTKLSLVLVDDANQNATVDGIETSLAEALDLAAEADSVVIMAGTISEEGADRATFTDISGKTLAQAAAAGNTLDWYAPRSNKIATNGEANTANDSGTTAMINAVLTASSSSDKPMYAKTVLVLEDNAGVALPKSIVGADGPSILEVWFPGQEDGNIVADLLFGQTNPSGKLPVTMPYVDKGFLDQIETSQFPGIIRAEDGEQAVTYHENLAIGYRWYDMQGRDGCPEIVGRNSCVAFPFGHGLSYTNFDYNKPNLARDESTGVWRASLSVSNTGERTGAEVVQAYITLPDSADDHGHIQPPRRLVGFQRVELQPGSTQTVNIPLDPSASHHPLSVWNESDKSWVIPKGRFTVWIGTSSSPSDLYEAGSFDR